MFRIVRLLVLLPLIFISCSNEENNNLPQVTSFKLEQVSINEKTSENIFTDINPEASIKLVFSNPVDKNAIIENIRIIDKEKKDILFTYTLADADKTIEIKPKSELQAYMQYQLIISPNFKSQSGTKIMTGKSYTLLTSMDMTDKFPRIPDEELLDLVQKQTFNYFWDFGHPVSGMARERTTSSHTVTSGGTGFGIMAMIVAAERGFITRGQAAQRVLKIANFLDLKCEKYHGAFAHWIHGETGAILPFSTKDNGADIVETALLFQGLLTARQYFNDQSATEQQINEIITRLWENIDWTWFQKNGENTLYWHWSPEFGWDMNLKVSGWNESLITYVLAASSPTHSIKKEVYDKGWTLDGRFVNGKNFYGIKLPLGVDYGGPLFLSQYSFLGINPKNLTDEYANYWEQNRNHTLINYQHSVNNPKGYAGYSNECWGLTASDGDKGYSAHSPSNDKGVIAPTAALSAMPYTPEESMKALHFFYYKLGDKLWSEYGFYDAFNLSAQWFDNQHIAIDQGTIIIMIENHRSELLWKLFMSIPEIKSGMKKLGFESPNL